MRAALWRPPPFFITRRVCHRRCCIRWCR
jgi:hypothetical protein